MADRHTGTQPLPSAAVNLLSIKDTIVKEPTTPLWQAVPQAPNLPQVSCCTCLLERPTYRGPWAAHSTCTVRLCGSHQECLALSCRRWVARMMLHTWPARSRWHRCLSLWRWVRGRQWAASLCRLDAHSVVLGAACCKADQVQGIHYTADNRVQSPIGACYCTLLPTPAAAAAAARCCHGAGCCVG